MNRTDYYLVIISMPLIVFAIGWVAVSLNNFYDETYVSMRDKLEATENRLIEANETIHELKMRYAYNDVFTRFEYCDNAFDFYGSAPTKKECMAGMNFVKHRDLPTPSPYEYFSPLDWEISEKCGRFEAIDSSLCKIINNL
jgi:hypothetical protein